MQTNKYSPKYTIATTREQRKRLTSSHRHWQSIGKERNPNAHKSTFRPLHRLGAHSTFTTHLITVHALPALSLTTHSLTTLTAHSHTVFTHSESQKQRKPKQKKREDVELCAQVKQKARGRSNKREEASSHQKNKDKKKTLGANGRGKSRRADRGGVHRPYPFIPARVACGQAVGSPKK